MQIKLHELRRIIREELKSLSEHSPSEHTRGDKISALEVQRAADKLPAPRINPLTEVPPPRDKDEFKDSMSIVTRHPEVMMKLKPGTRIAMRWQNFGGGINVDDFAFGRVVGIAKTGGILGMGAQNWFVVETGGKRYPFSEKSLHRYAFSPTEGPEIWAHRLDFTR